MQGPYQVGGQTVYSGTQFRMWKGKNQDRVSKTSCDGVFLAKVAAKAGLTSQLDSLQRGRGSPEALVKLTQALIDEGQLRPTSSGLAADQIHDLQWRFAIGFDCAGYVYHAVTALHGDPAKLGLKSIGFEDFKGLPTNRHFEEVKAATDAQAGDILVLAGDGKPDSGNPGHNLIVRSHWMPSAGDATVDQLPSYAGKFLQTTHTDKTSRRETPDEIHAFEVDSSFGALSYGDHHGGVRRDFLLYNSTTNTWCTCRDLEKPTAVDGPVPYGEVKITGFFRAKATR
jgi:hypothetical protein